MSYANPPKGVAIGSRLPEAETLLGSSTKEDMRAASWPASEHTPRAIREESPAGSSKTSPTGLTRLPKKVRFAPMVKVVRVPGRWAMNEEDISAAWYAGKEIQRIKADAGDAITAMNRTLLFLPWLAGCPSLEAGGECTRGVEHRGNSADCEWRRTEKRRVLSAVRREQERQRRAGIRDLAAIANASRKYSRNARVLASKMGKSDALVADHVMSVGKSLAVETRTSPQPSAAAPFLAIFRRG